MKLYVGRQGHWHWCPGCRDLHCVPSRHPTGGWTFNGSMDAPTFSPSVKHTWNMRKEPSRICHYFIRDGRIEYCGDCFHPLSGQTVPLPDIPPDEIPDGWDQQTGT